MLSLFHLALYIYDNDTNGENALIMYVLFFAAWAPKDLLK